MLSTAFRISTTAVLASIALGAATLPTQLADAAENLASRQPAGGSADESQKMLATVEVESRRQREVVRRQVDSYVTAVLGDPCYESLTKWHDTICPLVAGVPREHGEFILARVSQIAAAAHARLDSEKCHVNLYVIFSREPNVLPKKWHARDRRMFDEANGIAAIKAF